ncbi:hypothetical protein EVAR_102357_1 [Eumeta japonica]|uniref:Uncharacterized protein n=1 Tax=Eumeta variegata TaxID=151549 RepID=A0A4C1XJ37_EUMVA|nr:hypothetical protein EVAR_102357_1 [Eumeta japonica]
MHFISAKRVVCNGVRLARVETSDWSPAQRAPRNAAGTRPRRCQSYGTERDRGRRGAGAGAGAGALSPPRTGLRVRFAFHIKVGPLADIRISH